MKVVLDTNVLLAGIATHGLCEGLVTLSFRDHTVILSDHILDEVIEHYVDKFGASDAQARAVATTFAQLGQVVTPAPVPHAAFEDVDDLPVLGTAVAGDAEVLVTGDKRLLALAEYEGITIESPRAFYERVRG